MAKSIDAMVDFDFKTLNIKPIEAEVMIGNN